MLQRVRVPGYITHYHLPGRRPLLNLSDVAEPELRAVIEGLKQDRRDGKHQRTFGPRYMGLRRATETRLRELFIAADGKPQRAAPHYFVLGSCRWFEGLAPNMASITLPLDGLCRETTSFTYPDSFAALADPPGNDAPRTAKPYNGRVFLLDDLPRIVERYGLPDDDPDEDYNDYHDRPFEKYIEVQLWSDSPVREYLARDG